MANSTAVTPIIWSKLMASCAAVLTLVSALAAGSTALAADLSRLALPGGPATMVAPKRLTVLRALSPSRIDPSLANAQGSVEVWVKLTSPGRRTAADEFARMQCLARWACCNRANAEARASSREPAMRPVGKPDAGDPHVRFDERGGETDGLYSTAPLRDSTVHLPVCLSNAGADVVAPS